MGINERKRIVNVEMGLLGELISVQMSVNDVEKISSNELR